MNINEFITPSLLKSIHAEDLKLILASKKDEISQASLWYDDRKRSFPINPLVKYLREISLPRDIEDALFVISSLAKNDSEEVLIELMNLGLDTGGDETKMATLLWFKAPEKCKEILAKEEIKKPRKYNYYKPVSEIANISAMNDNLLNNAKSELSTYFAQQSKSSYLMLLQNENEQEIFVSIFHGSNKKRKTTVDSSGSETITFRDEVADILRINKETGSIGICLRYRSKHIEKHYLDLFKEIFAPQTDYIREDRFSLIPLYDIERALSVGTLSNVILSFRLKELIAYVDGHKIVISGKEIQSIWNKLPIKSSTFKKAKFGILFADDSTEREITITPPFGIEYPERCGHDSDIDKLLRENGFIMENIIEAEVEDVDEFIRVGA